MLTDATAQRHTAGTLIVGAGQAGLDLAASLREMQHPGRITLVSGEAELPYQRPPLPKAYLASTAEEAEPALRGEDFYEANDIDVLRGEWIENIPLTGGGNGAGEARTKSGLTLGLDKLALTVGGGAPALAGSRIRPRASAACVTSTTPPACAATSTRRSSW